MPDIVLLWADGRRECHRLRRPAQHVLVGSPSDPVMDVVELGGVIRAGGRYRRYCTIEVHGRGAAFPGIVAMPLDSQPDAVPARCVPRSGTLA